MHKYFVCYALITASWRDQTHRDQLTHASEAKPPLYTMRDLLGTSRIVYSRLNEQKDTSYFPAGRNVNGWAATIKSCQYLIKILIYHPTTSYHKIN